mmetsp:Transcript_103177/g.181866  ORF Transcript_103177/g.181866 Transcript_103177/m.181866 type:complete len:749 (-) Transcript_103177:96-2342(-)
MSAGIKVPKSPPGHSNGVMPKVVGPNVQGNREEYQLVRRLQSALFGGVYEAKGLTSNRDFAIKVLHKSELTKAQESSSIEFCEVPLSEIRFADLMRGHEHVMEPEEHFEDAYCFYVVFELARGGDLLEALKQKPHGFDEAHAQFLIKQAAKGLAFLHDRRVAMQDVSLENMLLHVQETTGHYQVKICDPGQAVIFEVDQNGEEMPVNFRGLVGKSFRPPELHDQVPYAATKVDSWCLGWSTFYLLTAQPLFMSADPAQQDSDWLLFQQGDFATLFQQKSNLCSHQGLDFIFRMLQIEPRRRMSITDALNHHWLADPTILPVLAPKDVLPEYMVNESSRPIEDNAGYYHDSNRPAMLTPRPGNGRPPVQAVQVSAVDGEERARGRAWAFRSESPDAQRKQIPADVDAFGRARAPSPFAHVSGGSSPARNAVPPQTGGGSASWTVPGGASGRVAQSPSRGQGTSITFPRSLSPGFSEVRAPSSGAMHRALSPGGSIMTTATGGASFNWPHTAPPLSPRTAAVSRIASPVAAAGIPRRARAPSPFAHVSPGGISPARHAMGPSGGSGTWAVPGGAGGRGAQSPSRSQGTSITFPRSISPGFTEVRTAPSAGSMPRAISPGGSIVANAGSIGARSSEALGFNWPLAAPPMSPRAAAATVSRIASPVAAAGVSPTSVTRIASPTGATSVTRIASPSAAKAQTFKPGTAGFAWSPEPPSPRASPRSFSPVPAVGLGQSLKAIPAASNALPRWAP